MIKKHLLFTISLTLALVHGPSAIAVPMPSEACGGHLASTTDKSPLNSKDNPMQLSFGGANAPKSILVIAAMDVEESAIRSVLTDFKEITLSKRLNLILREFDFAGRKLLLARSGIGLVNAGLITGFVADQYQIDGIILLGVAGALDENLAIGDLVVASKVIQHDSVFSGTQGVELMAPGAPYVSVTESERENPEFSTNAHFRSWLNEVMPNSLKEGVLLSGSEFVGSPHAKRALAARFPGAMAVEMEAAAIAMMGRQHNLPVSVVKTIVDRLNPDDTISYDYNAFIESASAGAAKIASTIRAEWEK